jgi:hypothetical protein
VNETYYTERKHVDWDTLSFTYDPMSVLLYLVKETEGKVLREGGTKTQLLRRTITIEVEGVYEPR